MHVLHYNNGNVHTCIYTDWVSYVLLYLLYNKKVGWTLSNQKCFILCWSLNRIFGTSQAYSSRPCRSATNKNTQKIMISAWIGTNSYRRLECRLYVTKARDVRTNIIAMFIWSVVLVNTNLQNRDLVGHVTLFCSGLLNIAIVIIPADIVSR